MDELAKLKPYTFWIVTGLILLAQLIYFGFILEARHPEKGWDAPYAVDQANSKFRTLLREDKKAQEVLRHRGGLVPGDLAIKPDDKDKVKGEFIEKFLMHPDWEAEFYKVIKDYETQIGAIRADLVRRSRVLGDPISNETDNGPWTQDYIERSVALLREMYASKRLVSPRLNPPPTIEELERKEEWRAAAGVRTPGGGFIEQNQRGQVTSRYRIIEALWAIVRDAAAPAKANPRTAVVQGVEGVAPVEGGFDGQFRPTWVKLEWAREDRGEPAGLPGAEGATSHPFSLTLRGHPSVLLEIATTIDNLHAPVVVRTGSSWNRLRERKPGALLGQQGEQMELTLKLTYLDFRPLGQAP